MKSFRSWMMLGSLLGVLLVSAVVSADPGTVSVGFLANAHGSRGTFVDVTAIQNLNVTGFGMNLTAGETTISVYRKVGPTTMADTTNAAAWTLYQNVQVVGVGWGSATNVPITPAAVSAGQTVAFVLVAPASGPVGNAFDSGVTTSASDAAISIFSAYEMHGLFDTTYQGWPFQGSVSYDTTGATPIPTLSQWGLIGLSLLLAAAGVVRMRQLGA